MDAAVRLLSLVNPGGSSKRRTPRGTTEATEIDRRGQSGGISRWGDLRLVGSLLEPPVALAPGDGGRVILGLTPVARAS
jgi:hypothetical protein